MNKKIVVFGGGTGQSILLKGLKKFPFDITAVVTVSDDGKSSGILRNDFHIPAVGDVRRVAIALSETEDIIEKLVDYRFKGKNCLSGHTVGNIILAALCDINGSLSNGVKSISSILNLKGKVLPLTDEYTLLVGKTEDGSCIYGESEITACNKKINDIFYKNNPKVNNEVISSIKNSDAIILSMGSLFTSIIPNLICKEVIDAIDESKCKIIYVCNIMTQPGESDNFKVSDHINLLNKYLGNRKIEMVVVNSGKIDKGIIKKYATKEQKDLVKYDKINIDIDTIEGNFIMTDNEYIRHDSVKLGFSIYGYLDK